MSRKSTPSPNETPLQRNTRLVRARVLGEPQDDATYRKLGKAIIEADELLKEFAANPSGFCYDTRATNRFIRKMRAMIESGDHVYEWQIGARVLEDK
jgi:hypothetical protein